MSLNSAQAHAVAAALMQLEQALADIERLLDGPVAGVTQTFVTDMSPITVQQVRQGCDEIRGRIAELIELFQLPQRRWNVRRVIVAEMTSAWCSLEDSRPAKLRHYGAVYTTLIETLDSRLDRLSRLVMAVKDLASKGQ